MSILINTYSESNQDADLGIGNNTDPTDVGEIFIASSGSYTLTSCKFFLKLHGTPTGNAVAKIYNTTGTYHTNAKPTGSVLATSDNVDVTTVGSSYSLITFTFSGGNQITLSQNQVYALDLSYSSGDAVNGLYVGVKVTPSNDPANYFFSFNSGSTWSGSTADGVPYYVYGNLIANNGMISFI